MIGKFPLGGGNHSCNFYDVVSIENLIKAWKEFKKGKCSKMKVAEFELKLEENLFALHRELLGELWKPKPYKRFFVKDPKLREIHEADIRDMVLYQALYQKLYEVFDPVFISNSFSSRKYKGTHAGVKRFSEFSKKVSQNHTKQAFVLKCDIRKYFDSIDQEILFGLIKKRVKDEKLLNLIKKVIYSFEKTKNKGLPLGNVTSQLFANIYLNESDQFIKHKLKIKYYVRYCDDFVILSEDLKCLADTIPQIRRFLSENLKLVLHPNKISIRKLKNGTDFLGYVSLSHYSVLRTRTKNRMFGKISILKNQFEKGLIDEKKLERSVQSYLGMLKHCKGEKIGEKIERIFWD